MNIFYNNNTLYINLEEEINEYIKKNLYSLDRIYIDKGDNK